jgi:isopentenyl diphosphate isomerase/L-lactate dehydrogenase-like FMN-dependent dehydrogenase
MSNEPASLGEFEAFARAKLPAPQWNWVVGAAENGRTYLRNLNQFRDFYLRPRVLAGITSSRLESNFFGQVTASPIVAAPIGHMTQFDADGELAVMQACNETKTHCVVSMHTRRNLELLASAAGSAGWSYQLYLYSDPEVVLAQVERAVRLGATSVVLTVDSSHRSPSFQRQQLPWDARKHGKRDEPHIPESRNDRLWTWPMIAHLIKHVEVPVIVKGIQHAEDALRVQDSGCKAAWISNHGGRVNETDQSLLRELVKVRRAVGREFPLVIDGGFRTGSDLAKALILGTSHVALGRPLIYGLVEDGSRGIKSVINIAQSELAVVLGALGVSSVQDIANHTDLIGYSYDYSNEGD